jgi:DNA-binding transcriptional LysR family regulator
LAAAMLEGRADLAVGPVPPGFGGVARHLGSEEFVVVTAVDDPAATRGWVPLADLADREWVHFTPASGLADILDRVGAACGFQPRAAVRTEQAPAAANYASAGLGPTLVPANTVPLHFRGAVLQPDPPVRRALAAYTRTEPDPVTAALVDELLDKVPLTPDHVRRRMRPPASGAPAIEV